MNRQNYYSMRFKFMFILTIIVVLIGLTSKCEAQTKVINDGEFNEAYDQVVVSGVSLGNSCDELYFMYLYYRGDMTLKGPMYINDCVLTVYGEFDYNGYDVYYDCPNGNLIIDNETLGVPEGSLDDFVTYPNPTNGVFYVKTKEVYSVEVYDVAGKLVNNKPDLTNLPSGTYIAIITIGTRKESKKIIKR